MRSHNTRDDDRQLSEMLRLMCRSAIRGETSVDRRWHEVNTRYNPLWSHRLARSENVGVHDIDSPVFASVSPQEITSDELGRSAIARYCATIVCAAFLGAAFVFGSELRALESASVAAYAEDLTSRFRDGGTVSSPGFSRGISALFEARGRGWASLRPSSASLELAVRELEVSFKSTSDPFLRAEVAFFLGKAHLMLHDRASAAAWLRTGIAQRVEDYQAESYAMLRSLDATGHSPIITN
jgi:hypothetical protein